MRALIVLLLVLAGACDAGPNKTKEPAAKPEPTLAELEVELLLLDHRETTELQEARKGGLRDLVYRPNEMSPEQAIKLRFLKRRQDLQVRIKRLRSQERATHPAQPVGQPATH